MNVKDKIINELAKSGTVSVNHIAKLTGISRQAAHKHFKELVRSGKIIKIGKTRGSHYILNEPKSLKKNYGAVTEKRGWLEKKGLHEDLVLRELKSSSHIFDGFKENVSHIIDYAFTEMLNNAIDHSCSKKIFYSIKRERKTFTFNINDQGVGIYANIKEKYNLKSEWDALQELIKGKSTTKPEEHSGEGIFFTSKIADKFNLSSHGIELFVDNTIDDIFVKEVRKYSGTKVAFSIEIDTQKNLADLFAKYSTEELIFDKSKINVKLFAERVDYVSRSQAKRLLENLDKYQSITLDFNGVETIGQGFADQIFRVFQKDHPNITFEVVNCSKPVFFMINRAKEASK